MVGLTIKKGLLQAGACHTWGYYKHLATSKNIKFELFVALCIRQMSHFKTIIRVTCALKWTSCLKYLHIIKIMRIFQLGHEWAALFVKFVTWVEAAILGCSRDDVISGCCYSASLWIYSICSYRVRSQESLVKASLIPPKCLDRSRLITSDHDAVAVGWLTDQKYLWHVRSRVKIWKSGEIYSESGACHPFGSDMIWIWWDQNIKTDPFPITSYKYTDICLRNIVWIFWSIHWIWPDLIWSKSVSDEIGKRRLIPFQFVKRPG